MAQAQNGLHLTNAIREILSRGTAHHSTHPAKEAHAQFDAAFAKNRPRPIFISANDDDFKARAEHLENVIAAFAAYVIAVSEDCNMHGSDIDTKMVEAQFSNINDDVVGPLERRAEYLRTAEHEGAW